MECIKRKNTEILNLQDSLLESKKEVETITTERENLRELRLKKDVVFLLVFLAYIIYFY